MIMYMWGTVRKSRHTCTDADDPGVTNTVRLQKGSPLLRRVARIFARLGRPEALACMGGSG